MLLKEVIEALVFASQKPLTTKEIVSALRRALEDSDEEPVRAMAKLKEAEVGAFLEQLRFEYEHENRAFQLVEQVDGWLVVTKPDYALWVRQLYPESKPTRLSGPALETLAIIAYRQPVTRADIEAVRGVAVDGVMQSLLERGLVRIAGRADVPGRPLLYETTQVFMQHFGLRTLEELPNVDELRRAKLPTATPPTTGELFPPGAMTGAGEAPAPEPGSQAEQPTEMQPDIPAEEAGTETPAAEAAPEAEPAAEPDPAPEDGASGLPPEPEPDLTAEPALSGGDPEPQDHAADLHPQEN